MTRTESVGSGVRRNHVQDAFENRALNSLQARFRNLQQSGASASFWYPSVAVSSQWTVRVLPVAAGDVGMPRKMTWLDLQECGKLVSRSNRGDSDRSESRRGNAHRGATAFDLSSSQRSVDSCEPSLHSRIFGQEQNQQREGRLLRELREEAAKETRNANGTLVDSLRERSP